MEDTGVGIAPADQARIFDEFAMLENPAREVGEGTGLGLAICRRLAGLLGGEVHLRSARGIGRALMCQARTGPKQSAKNGM